MGINEGNDDGGKGDGNGDSDKDGNGGQPRQHKKRVASSNDGSKGDGEGDSTKDMVAYTTPAERGVIRVGHDTYARYMIDVID